MVKTIDVKYAFYKLALFECNNLNYPTKSKYLNT